MPWDLLVLIFIALIVINIGILYLRLQRDPDRPQPRATFSERGYQNPKAFEYISSIMSKLEMADAQVLKRYVNVNVNDQSPTTDIELLDLIYQNIIWQMIGDGRAGTVGNQHADEVIYYWPCPGSKKRIASYSGCIDLTNIHRPNVCSGP